MPVKSALIRVIHQLSLCREAPAVMAVLRQAARDLTGADGVSVILREGDECHYVEENAISPLWKGRRFPLESCVSGWVILHRQAVAIADVYADPRVLHEAFRPTFVKSLALVPIGAGGEPPLGALGAYWASRHEATETELEVLQALAGSAATALANVHLLESLELANRRKDEFLHMLAHELRNPLAPIRNALHLLRLGPGDALAERTREMMERQVQHLARIVDDLLDVARITRGKATVRRERLDLGRLVYQAAEDRRAVLEGAGLALRVELPQVPVWVRGDRTRLAQVLGNLLDNAAKFTPAGGRVTVGLAADSDARQAVVSVRDTGVGIEPPVLPYVFDVFTQADRSLDRSGGGLGLGLSVARGLVQLHGGTIEAASAGPGRGAEITFRLPLEPELPALTRTPHSVPPPRKRLRVLVVEDNRDSAESLRLLLEAFGNEVAVAHSGPEGLAAAKAMRPDVVLCDIGLPGLDGFGVAAALRQSPETAAARLIAVTGYGDEEDRRRSREAGFDVHLVKPVEPERLLAQVSV